MYCYLLPLIIMLLAAKFYTLCSEFPPSPNPILVMNKMQKEALEAL